MVDAEGGEVNCGPAEEVRAGGGLLVGVDFAVGEACVLINCGVDVVEAGDTAAVGAGDAAVNAPAAAVGDAAELLHINMDHFAGPVAFVAADDSLVGHCSVEFLEAAADGEYSPTAGEEARFSACQPRPSALDEDSRCHLGRTNTSPAPCPTTTNCLRAGLYPQSAEALVQQLERRSHMRRTAPESRRRRRSRFLQVMTRTYGNGTIAF